MDRERKQRNTERETNDVRLETACIICKKIFFAFAVVAAAVAVAAFVSVGHPFYLVCLWLWVRSWLRSRFEAAASSAAVALGSGRRCR